MWVEKITKTSTAPGNCANNNYHFHKLINSGRCGMLDEIEKFKISNFATTLRGL